MLYKYTATRRFAILKTKAYVDAAKLEQHNMIVAEFVLNHAADAAAGIAANEATPPDIKMLVEDYVRDSYKCVRIAKRLGVIEA